MSPKRWTFLCVGVLAPVCGIVLSIMYFLRDDSGQSRRAGQPFGAENSSGTESPDVIRVQAVGHEFQWQFAYAGADGAFDTRDDIRSGRVLHLPAGRPVELQLTSRDYVYIMTLPMYGQREIAVPDMTHRLSFTPEEQMGTALPIDPMCGAGIFHKEAMGWLKVESPAQFRRWLSRQK